MKKITAIFLFIVILLIPFAETTLGKKNVYYQAGDHFKYAGKEILAAPNGREVELIEITRGDKFNKYQEFKTFGEPNNIIVETIGGNFTAIVLEGKIIASYNLNDLNSVKAENKIGPYWQFSDFYYDISPYIGNKFLTAGKNGISLWDIDGLQYKEKIYDKAAYGIAGYNYSIYGLTLDGALIFNAEGKKIVDKYIKVSEKSHKIFVDDQGVGFFPGDDVIKLRTSLEYKNLAHPSGVGNATSGFSGDKYIYFVNGWNIYKLDKDFNIILKENTSLESGDWSAGVIAVDLSQGKRVVVFNGNSMLLFDEELKLLDKYFYMPYSKENLQDKTMRVNPRHGSPGSHVLISGGGFCPGEEISLSFAGDMYILKANNKGETFKMAETPDILPGKANVLMKGKKSGFEHSFLFEVE
ncbi:MAG: hypothetical protein V1891_00005 [bacterium]